MAESKPAALTVAKDFVEAMLAASQNHGFDHELFKAMTVVSASLTPNPRVVTRLTVTLAMCNVNGTLHGGATSTLFDVCTTVALATTKREGTWESYGVTRTLSTTCLLPAFPGDEIEIEGEVVQVGKKLGKWERKIKAYLDILADICLVIAHILAKMTLVRNGKLVATGVHDKANTDPPAAMSGRYSKL